MNKKAAGLLAAAIALVAYAHTAYDRHTTSTPSQDVLSHQMTNTASLAAAKSVEKNKDTDQLASDAAGSLPARTITSESLTLDGLAAQMATDTNMTMEQARQRIEEESTNELGASDQTQYVVFTSFFHVNDTFTPYLKIYCEIEPSGSNHYLTRVISYHMVHIFGSMNKPFAGTVDVSLENPNKLHYVINGDFYEQGITTTQLDVSPDGLMRLTYAIANSTNWYAYVYTEQDIEYSE